MDQNKLFEAVRREDVVIFAGAGFSIYAGYPLGGQLAQIIYDRLMPAERKKVTFPSPLDYFAEEVVRVQHGSRNLINSVLDEVFHQPPVATTDHDLLAAIPHFRTVITTNYDALFENAYQKDANLIYREEDVALWNEQKVNILKIHGDLTDKASIILTRQDYARFYHKDYATPFWSTIIKAIATKTILFLGYGYEDPNVWSIFEHVYDHLGINRKDAYFIGPNAAEEKIEFLQAKGIHYLNHTGETFLNALLENIKLHIFEDMRNQWLRPESFRRFTRNHHLSVSLADSEHGYQVKSVGGIDGAEMHGNLKFSVASTSDFEQRYQSFMETGQSDELILGEPELTNFRMQVEGLQLFSSGEISHIAVKKTPKLVPFDLVFHTEDFEIRGLTAQIYLGHKSISIKTQIHTLQIELKLPIPLTAAAGGSWSMEHDTVYHNISEELEVHKFLKHFFSRKVVTFYLDGGGKLVKECPAYDAKRIEEAEMYLAYFGGLREVEKAFGVRFANFYSINRRSSEDLNWILRVIHGERFETTEVEELAFEGLSFETLDQLANLKYSDAPMQITMNRDLVMLLHDQPLPIPGLFIEIPMPEVINLTELQQGATKTIKLRSRSGTIYKKYSLEPFSVALEEGGEP